MEFEALEQELTRKIDLHLHTTASDGTLSPEELVEQAKAAGISLLAVTDHDTAAGVLQAQTRGMELGVEVISGIEISADEQGMELHILGYGLDPASERLEEMLDWVIRERSGRNEAVAARMRSDGIEVSVEALEAAHPGATIGRPHFARVLVEQGRAHSVAGAFRDWLNPGKPYYLPRRRLSLAQAVETIRGSGGLPVLAHPLQYGCSGPELRALTERIAAVGIAGMEIYYTGYGREQRRELFALAQEFGLLVTGGSDFHGSNKPEIRLGALEVPAGVALRLKEKLAEAAR